MSNPVNGRHLEAFFKQEKLYQQACNTAHDKAGNRAITALDYGCGAERGVSRTILENMLEQRDALLLYDEQIVRPSRRPNTRVVTEHAIWSPNPIKCDLISLSYVLCMMQRDEAKSLLQDLKNFQPDADFCIVDYTLRRQTRERVMQLLTADEEKKWLNALGEKDFLETHMRFGQEDIAGIAEDAGLRVHHAQPLDADGLRGGVLATAS